MKSRLKLMMGKSHKDTSYDLFAKNIRYVRKFDEAKLSTTGIALRIVKHSGVSEQIFREELGDSEMTHIIEQQNQYLQTTKQRIVRNLNDIDDEINFETNDDDNMEGSETTIREMFMKHIDNKVNDLFHSMEHTNNSYV
jgi:hypothetical protein